MSHELKKIGFIDYFLDEWHAEKYPGWIRSASGGRMSVEYAYGMTHKAGGLRNDEWCAKHGIKLLSSIEEVVESSDFLIVLSPDHPEVHEQLAFLALQSGKPTFVDKTFAPDRKTALQLFHLAERHGTPMYSASALRFAQEYVDAEKSGIHSICSIGPGRYDNYSVHQIEPIVSLMGNEAKRVMYIGTPGSPALLIDFGDQRQAIIHHFTELPFSMALHYDNERSILLKPESDFFGLFIESMIAFFESGNAPVSSKDTIAIVTIIEYGRKAADSPFQWVNLP